MKLSTIWSMPAMSTMERFRRTVDWSAMGVARHLPRRIKYWTTMQEIAKATRNSPNIPATPVEEVLKHLDVPKKLS